MPDSLVNDVDDRSIDGRKEWAIPSSTGIDKPRIDPACNGHLSRCNGRFRPNRVPLRHPWCLTGDPAVMQSRISRAVWTIGSTPR